MQHGTGSPSSARHGPTVFSPTARDDRMADVEIFFTILLVLCSIAIAWFAVYTVMRAITNESPDQ